jgi:hypothetical protein
MPVCCVCRKCPHPAPARCWVLATLRPVLQGTGGCPPNAPLFLLTSQAGSRESARTQLLTQLGGWQESGLLDDIAPERLAAYQLLAGEVRSGSGNEGGAFS